jgi:hypothetical protein
LAETAVDPQFLQLVHIDLHGREFYANTIQHKLTLVNTSGNMRASDKGMAPQVMETPRSPAHRKVGTLLWTPTEYRNPATMTTL